MISNHRKFSVSKIIGVIIGIIILLWIVWPKPETIPNAPSNLTAEAINSSSIKLSWKDNSNNETGFKVYRNLSNADEESSTLVTTTLADITSYTDAGLSASTTYYYRVKATNKKGDSNWSNTVSVTTKEKPISPGKEECDSLTGEERLECYVRNAIREKDPKVCSKLVNACDQWGCLFHFSKYWRIYRDWESMCDEQENYTLRGLCRACLAKEESDPLICLTGDKKVLSVCFSELAVITENLSVCNFLIEPLEHAKCYGYYAIFKKDLTTCNSFPGNEIDYEAAICYGFFAVGIKDLSICNSLSQRPVKYSSPGIALCYSFYAASNKDPSICAKLENQPSPFLIGQTRDFCYYNYVKFTEDYSVCQEIGVKEWKDEVCKE